MTTYGAEEMVKDAEECHGADVAAQRRWASEAPNENFFPTRELKYLDVLPEAGKQNASGKPEVKVA